MKLARILFTAATVSGALTVSSAAMAQSEPYIGQLMVTPYTFCPRGWIETNGQLLAIQSNAALFSLLGTNYGGNGIQTFGVPNLQGRFATHVGSLMGNTYTLGQVGGTTQVTMTVSQMPAHTHTFNASSGPPATGVPTGAQFGDFGSGTPIYSNTGSNLAMSPASISPQGGNQPLSIQNPYLTLRWCIATQGVFPSRN